MNYSFRPWFRRVASLVSGRAGRPGRDRGGRAPARPRLEALEARDVPTGTWAAVTSLAPTTIGTMMLLSDGTVLAQGGGSAAAVKTWFRLTPDSSGSYVGGTWSALPSMNLERLYYGSNVLPDGRVFVVGGEYSGPGTTQNFTNTGEIYDPARNTWSTIANFPLSQYGDDPTMVLPDGRVLAGYLGGPQTFIYNPATNSWSPAGTKLRNDRSDEETWVKLPDDSVLSYEVFTESGGVGHAQRYIPSTNTWVDAGTVPTTLSGGNAFGFEMGGAVLLPDGRVWFLGANSHTAFYDPSTNSWAAGPSIPNNGSGQLQGADDAPAAMLPNGHVLLAVDHPLFGNPLTVYEFDPATNTYANVTPAVAGLSTNVPAFRSRMLMLPSGQVLYTTGGSRLAVFTPDEGPSDSWRPAVASISASGSTFTLTGTQLNGLSAGASYGDDAEMDSNYPIVRLQDGAGTVAYARTSNWSSTGVATGATPETVDFTLPSGFNPGIYLLNAVANGIASPTALHVQMTPTSNDLVIRVDPGAGGNVQVVQDGTVLAEYGLGAINSILVTGDSSDDTLTVDYQYGDPLPAGGLNYQEGAGVDTLNVNDQSTTTDQTFTLAANGVQRSGSAPITYGNGVSFVNVNSGSGNNTFDLTAGTSAAAAVSLGGGGGANTLLGSGAANLWAIFGADSGTLSGAAYATPVTFSGVGSLTAGGGGDTFQFADGATLSGSLTGGGADTLDYSAYSTSVVVDLQTGQATGVGGSVSGISTVLGGTGNGALGAYNLLIGGATGGDTLTGGLGRRNILVAGGGPSTLNAGDQEDLLIGGTTAYDTEAGLVSWQQIASYWAGTDDYATRVANLTSGSGVPLLDTTTVSGNGGGNVLSGNGALALLYTDGLDAIAGFDPGSQTVTIAP
jgi:hypothetical protein